MFRVSKLRDKTFEFVNEAQETIYKVILVLLTVTALLWISVFLYASFYYSYIPPVSHTRPIYLQFSRSCERSSRTMCNFPSANVTLTRREQFLMVGQPYKILVELEMPESSANQNLGMFMVCAVLQTKDGGQVEESCRSTMLQYKSTLLHMISTVLLYPFLFSGSYEEKQLLAVELFTGFQEDTKNPVTDAFIELQSYDIEVYKASLKIHAHFTGLRYLMFHWPLTSAVLGICTNLFFLSVIAFLSWFKFFKPHHPIVVHVGYDSSQVKTLEERHEQAKERILKEKDEYLVPSDTERELEVPVWNKEDLEGESLEGNDDEESVENSTELFEDEDQIVPESTRAAQSSSSEESLLDVSGYKNTQSSDEFEVVGNRRKESSEDETNPGFDDQGQGDHDIRQRVLPKSK